MTTQPPQEEVEEVTRAMGAVLLTGSISLTAAHINDPELLSRMAAAAIATLDRLRSAAPAAGKDMGVAAGAAPLDLYAGPWRWTGSSLICAGGGIALSAYATAECPRKGDYYGCNHVRVTEQLNCPAGLRPLIAAAPDLLAACNNLLKRYLAMGCGEGIEARAAQIAIAKATAPADEAAEPVRSEPKASEPAPSLPAPPKEKTDG